MWSWLSSLLVARAASSDPDLHWRTLSTEHFELHFHQGIEQLADEYARLVEEVFAEMTEEVAWVPRQRIQVVLVDRTDDANGFASSVPYNFITLYVTAPTGDSSLALYEDWNRTIFTHELTHVLHLDTNHGMVRVARHVVGKVAASNQVSPGWVVEGFATFQETRHTSGGRGRSAVADMIKRTAVAEDTFPPLGNLDGFQPRLPSGNLRYLFGQDFIQYVADRAGEDVWTSWVHTYGSWWTPGFFLPTRRVFGQPLSRWYAAWKEDTTTQYQAQLDAVRADGETVVRVVSGEREATDRHPAPSCSSPSFSPDGKHLVYSCYDPRTGSALWLADGEGTAPVKLLQDFGAGYVTWRNDSKAFVYSASHLVNQFNYWDDVYLFELATKSVTTLTSGARARDPEFSPDGTRLLMVTNRAQNNQLEVLTVDRQRQPLTEFADHTQLDTPRYAPDGRAVALSVWRDGRRDLWLWSPDGDPLRQVTSDVALDTDPTWSADGKWLFFTSDRSGIPNIYAIDLATEHLWQVTNVTTGAARPSVHPSGERLAFQRYHTDGWEVVVTDLDPARYRDLGQLPAPLDGGPPLVSLAGPRPETTPPETAAFTVDPAAATDLRPAAHRPFVFPEPVPLARAAGRVDLSAGREPFPQSSETVQTFADTRVEDAFGEEADYPFSVPPHRYDPLRTLKPTYVLPYFQTTAFAPSDTFGFSCLPGVVCRGIQASVSTSQSDALRRYGWSLFGAFRTDVDAFSGAASVTVNRFLPVYSFGVATSASPTVPLLFFDPDAPVDENGDLALFQGTGNSAYYTERRTTSYAVVSWPYRLRTTLFAQYAFTDRRPRYALPTNVFTDSLPLIGYTGAVSGGWRYTWSQPTPYSISAEDGRVFSLVGSLLLPQLGTFVREPESGTLQPTSLVQVTGELREYVTNPLAENHVLAARAAGGWTFGANDFLGNYVLGGSIGDAGFAVTPDEFRMVRGYDYGSDVGDQYWLFGLEYRFPLLRVERGLGTAPVYARTLSASLFLDGGNAFVNPSVASGTPSTASELGAAAIDEPLLGAGGELVWRLVVMYGVGLDGRLGYGVSLRGDGFAPTEVVDGARVVSLQPLYFRLGGSF
jgi:hypothetical protein